MKIRILETGFTDYTGMFGSVEFVNGVSVDISQAEAQRFGSVMRVEVEGTGVNPSVTQALVDDRNKNLVDVGGSTKTLAELDAEAKAAAKKAEANRKKQEAENGPKTGAEQNGGVPVDSPKDLDFSYTVEDLKELVGKQGIAGLRSFAEPYGIKGRAVKGIIDDLMELKQNSQPAAPVAEAPVQQAGEGEENDVLEVGGETPAPVKEEAAAPVDQSNDNGFGSDAPEGTEFIGDDEGPDAVAPVVNEAAEGAEAPGTGEGFLDEDLDAELAALEAEADKE